MPRRFEACAQVPLAPATFWALRLDEHFDHHCAAAENCTFTLLSVSRGRAADGSETVTMQTELMAEESPLPSALQTLLGAKKFALASRSTWCTEHHDRAHHATFETTPKVMSQRCCIRGQSWLEAVPARPNACVVRYRIEIDVRILALSSLLEQGLEKRLRDSCAALVCVECKTGKRPLSD